jgi:hypothetical protein
MSESYTDSHRSAPYPSKNSSEISQLYATYSNILKKLMICDNGRFERVARRKTKNKLDLRTGVGR